MSALFASPHLVDLVLVFTALEAAAMLLWRRRTGTGLRPAAVLAVLLPGVCLMLALRAVLAGAAWPWLPVALLAALASHLADLWMRWRREGTDDRGGGDGAVRDDA